MSNTRKWLLIVSILVIGAVAILSVAIAVSLDDWQTVPLGFAMIVGTIGLAFATLYLVFCLTIIIHELGHLAVVWLVQGKPLCVNLPHINLYFRNGRYTGCRWRDAAAIYMVQYVPRSTALLPYTAVIAAGPLANIMAGMLAWHLAIVAEPANASGWSLTYNLAALSVWLNLAMGLGNLLPFRTSGFASDGLQLLGLTFTPKRARERLALATAFYSSLQSRPRDTDPDLMAATVDPKRQTGYWELLHYWCAMDRNEVAGAEPWLREAWLKIRDGSKKHRALREAGGYETAIYFTRFIHDPDLANEAASRMEKEFPKSERREILEAARLWTAGKDVEAARRLAKVWLRIKAIQNSDSLTDHVDDWFQRILDPAIPTTEMRLPAPQAVT